jgi:hypothetical protein
MKKKNQYQFTVPIIILLGGRLPLEYVRHSGTGLYYSAVAQVGTTLDELLLRIPRRYAIPTIINEEGVKFSVGDSIKGTNLNGAAHTIKSIEIRSGEAVLLLGPDPWDRILLRNATLVAKVVEPKQVISVKNPKGLKVGDVFGTTTINEVGSQGNIVSITRSDGAVYTEGDRLISSRSIEILEPKERTFIPKDNIIIVAGFDVDKSGDLKIKYHIKTGYTGYDKLLSVGLTHKMRKAKISDLFTFGHEVKSLPGVVKTTDGEVLKSGDPYWIVKPSGDITTARFGGRFVMEKDCFAFSSMTSALEYAVENCRLFSLADLKKLRTEKCKNVGVKLVKEAEVLAHERAKLKL